MNQRKKAQSERQRGAIRVAGSSLLGGDVTLILDSAAPGARVEPVFDQIVVRLSQQQMGKLVSDLVWYWDAAPVRVQRALGHVSGPRSATSRPRRGKSVG